MWFTENQLNSVTISGLPVSLICINAPTLKPKDANTNALPIKQIAAFDKLLRPRPLITKPDNGNKGISQMYLSMCYVVRNTLYVFIQLIIPNPKSKIRNPKFHLPFQPVQHVNIYRVCISVDHNDDG